jgi:plastocyanin
MESRRFGRRTLMSRRSALLVILAFFGMLLVAPAAAGGGCYPQETQKMSASKSLTSKIEGCAFVSTVTYVQPGDSVTWVNEDPVPHSVSGALGSWGTEDYLEMGQKVTHTFKKEGVFPYYCVLHPSMVGAVVVGDADALLSKDAQAALSKGDSGVTEPTEEALAPVVPSGPAPTAARRGIATSSWLALAAIGLVGIAFFAPRTLARRRRADVIS